MFTLLLLACAPDATPECACIKDDTDAVVDTAPVDTDDTDPPDTAPVDTDDTDPPDTAPVDTDDTGDTDDTVVPPLQVYLLAGQSNMDGYGYVSGLPPSLQVAQPDVRLYWSGLAAWADLGPASYGSFYGVEYFGPEVTFGRALADGDPGGSYALIKHAVGGTDLLYYWYPGTYRADPSQGEGYRAFLATIDAALAELDAAGTDWEIAGMIWMQGESDAFEITQAEAYGANLTTFIARVRDDVAVPDLPFSIGKIHCPTCVYGDIIRAGQDGVAATVPHVVAFDTSDLPINADGIHYDGSGMRTLGERFVQSLAGAPLSVTPTPAFTLTGGFNSYYTGNFFLGYSFTIDRPITVTDLGTLDYGLNGLAYASEVAIYDAATSTLVARTTVPANSSSPSAPWGAWRYAALEPLDLEPGSYVIASQVYLGSEDLYIFDAGFSAAAGFTWVEGRHKDYASVGLPTYVTSLPGNWFGPNLLYVER
ncbi:MAG: sialate O-acetylesterase [Myxococcota bacterium]